jgi:hypothetical protein
LQPIEVGVPPMIEINVTNTTGAAATLFGWIDYNADGVFDNASERAQAVVPDGVVGGAFTLAFPAVPEGFIGQTFARFRLSTDPRAANPTGPATDGEVEDHPITIQASQNQPPWHNLASPFDVDGDTNAATIADLLALVQFLRDNLPLPVPLPPPEPVVGPPPFANVDADNDADLADLLALVQEMRSRFAGGGEPESLRLEGEADPLLSGAIDPSAADLFFGECFTATRRRLRGFQ